MLRVALLLLLAGCPTAQPPPNARPCSTDFDCGDDEHCGFWKPDTRPVCLPGPPGPIVPDEAKRDGGN